MLPKGISRLWLPVLIALLGMATTLSAWDTLRRERRTREASTLASVAGDSRQAIEAAAERQIEAMRDLAASWARFGPRSLEAWRFEADRTLEIFPGLASLAWVGRDGKVIRVADGLAPQPLPDSEERRTLLAEAAGLGESQRVAMEGPLGSDGGFGYDLLVPAFDESGRAGVLVASVSIERMLGAILHDSAPGYAVAVSWKGRKVFQRGEADSGHPWWRSRDAIELSTGTRWEASYAPTPALVASSLSPWPDYFLAGGLLLSVMLGILIHQLRAAEGTVRSLDDINRELERRVEERTRELAGAVGDLESFNYSVSHDLRSPLGSIVTFAALVEEDFAERLGPEGSEWLARIRASAETSMELLDGLLELSRTGRSELRRASTDLAALAREVWAEVDAGATDGVQLEIGPLPPASGDPLLLRQVLVNLLRNALKFSATREKPRIEIGGRTLADENVYYVRDNGVGFDMRFAGKLFRPFERLHAEERFKGTGVGLAIVSRIVARHGGRVWAEGEPDVGASFFFSLPRARRETP